MKGEENGLWGLFWEDGTQKQEEFWRNGRMLIITDVYFADDSLTSGNLVNGNGTRIDYYPNKTIQERVDYVGGGMNGNWEFYDEEGNVSFRGQVVDNARNGEWTFYHPNGEVESKGIYKNDEMDGEWQFFTKKGKLKQTIDYTIEEEEEESEDQQEDSENEEEGDSPKQDADGN